MIDLSSATIRDVQAQAFRTAEEHGFHPAGEEPKIDQKLLLAIGELIEAQNELRSGHTPADIYFPPCCSWDNDADGSCPKHPGPAKPEGFGIELADAVIRIFDLAALLGIDLQACVQLKMNYNEGRPFRHNKAF